MSKPIEERIPVQNVKNRSQLQCLSVIIPVLNERKSIETIISQVIAQDVVKEIIIVDDGSSDGTIDIIKSKILPRFDHVVLLQHEKNFGKGMAIRTGIKAVTGDIVIIQDADLEYSPTDFPALVEPILSGKSKVVYGSRFQKVNSWLFIWQWFSKKFFGHPYEIRYLHHFVGILALNTLTFLLYGCRISDEATCYKVFKLAFLKASS